MYSNKIFREYDIRGVYGKDYDAEFAALLGRAVAAYYRANVKPAKGRKTYRISIGRDARLSGNEIAPKLMQTLTQEGFDVYDIGVVPTPVVYFSTFHLDVDGAIAVTGSHNPPEYNGFKVGIGTTTLHGEQIQVLSKLCGELKTTPAPTGTAGKIQPYNILLPYHEDLIKRVKLGRKLTVVLDAGNGPGGLTAPKLVEAMGCKVIPLFCELDGRFPNHHPDPTVLENLKDLQKAVIANKADIGIAFDGDADRIGAVDETGRPLFGDELMVLYAREILTRKPGSTIISEVKSSGRLYKDIEKHGGRALMWKTGHSLIKAKMKQEHAELAGEMSGHMFFADRYYGYDDAVYAAIRLIELVSQQSKPLSQLLQLPPSVNTPEIRVDCPDEIKFEVVRRVHDELSRKFEVISVDGVRIETPTGWGLLRASNTQPVVVMRFEAQTETQLSSLQRTVEDAFKAATKAVQGGH